MNRISILFLAFFFSFFSSKAYIDPKIEWKILNTEHFHIIYDSTQRELAEKYGIACERAYHLLAPIFVEAPEKTTILLDDSTDIANGFATQFPYPFINIYPVMPTPLDSIAHHGKWENDLVLHEITHIFNMEPAHSFYRPLRWIFGSLIYPNALLPRWYSEGLAVEMETRMSRNGRLRSSSSHAILRALVIEDKLKEENLATIGEVSIPTWPMGQRPYLFGSLIFEKLGQEKNVSLFQELNQRYSRRVPYLINGPIEDHMGKDFPDLFNEIIDNYKKAISEQILQIEKLGPFNFQILNQESYFSHTPSISPDGESLIYIASNINADNEIRLHKKINGQINKAEKGKMIVQGKMIQSARWFPDSKKFVYDAIDENSEYFQYSDLFLFDLTTEKIKKLTTGLRAREPSVSPSGKHIVFVKVSSGKTELCLMNINGHHHKVLYAPKEGRISRPTFISNQQIVFSFRDTNGVEILKNFRIKDKKVQHILKDYHGVSFPHFTSKGLLFSSDQSGIPNIYLADNNLKIAQMITNSKTQAITGDLDPNTSELYFSTMTAEGLKVAVSPLTQFNSNKNKDVKNLESYRESVKNKKTARNSDSTISSEDPLNDNDVKSLNETKEQSEEIKVASISKNHWPELLEPTFTYHSEVTEDYSPWSYLIPRYWYPYLYLVPDGTAFEFVTGSQDILNRHAYSIILGTDTLTKKLNAQFQYGYYLGKTETLFSISDYHAYYYGLQLALQSTSSILSHLRPFSLLGKNWWWGLNFQFKQTDIISSYITRIGPGVILSYNDIKKEKGTQISPEKGKLLEAKVTTYLPELGNRSYERSQINSSFYFSSFLPDRHVLMTKVSAIYSPRNPSNFIGIDYSLGNLQSRDVPDTFLMRGYLSGNFRGRNLLNATLEYRLPISYTYWGYGTLPFFLQRIHGSIILDTVSLEGDYYSKEGQYKTTKYGRFFSGAGGEIHFETNVGYFLPLVFQLGLYYGLDLEASGQFISFLGVML